MRALKDNNGDMFWHEGIEYDSYHSSELESLRDVLSFSFGYKSDSIAHYLLENLGSTGRILFGKLETSTGCPVQPDVAAFLLAIRALVDGALESRLKETPVLSDSPALRSYLLAKSAFYPSENFRVLYLNAAKRLISDDLQAVGSINSVAPVPRQIIHRALDLGAAGMVLVHNHPSGDMRASRADITMTRRIAGLSEPLDIKVFDHIIVTRGGLGSMREAGMF